MKKIKFATTIIGLAMLLCSCSNNSQNAIYNPQGDDILHRSEITTEDASTVPDFSSAEVGDIITFGAFEQDYTSNNGAEDIEWLVLDKKSDRILVISKNILKGQRSVNELWSWDISPMRRYLNDEFFYYAFTAKQQEVIMTVTNSTPATLEFADPGSDTQDKIFLLSNEEVEKYFSSDNERKSTATVSAKAEGCTEDWWLLRTHGIGNMPSGVVRYWTVQFVDENGTFDEYGCHVDYAGLRPAMWIDTTN